jgi:hypothetical protein
MDSLRNFESDHAPVATTLVVAALAGALLLFSLLN